MKSKIVCYLTALLMSSVVYSQERTVLRVWDDPQRVDFLNDSVKPFEEMYNCDVIFEPVDLHNQVRRFLALPPNATKPDIILLESSALPLVPPWLSSRAGSDSRVTWNEVLL